MKTVVEMTREAGGFDATPKFLERFAELVRADEREQALAAPVQATMKLESSGPGHGPAPKQKLSVRHVSLIDEGKTAAQPIIKSYLEKDNSAQPAPVQEPVAFFDPQKESFYWAKPTRVIPPVTVDVEPLPLYTTPPAAHLAVPDRLTIADKESADYHEGWNDCRALMLEMRKP